MTATFLFWLVIQMQIIIAKPYDVARHDTHSCMDLFKSGERSDGYYQLVGADGEIWIAYCDFNSELGSVWTLVMSWSFENRNAPAFYTKSLAEDAPVNDLSPNWAVYRMSKIQMNFLKERSTHWRITCSFDKIDIDYVDYLRGNFGAFDITSFSGQGTCRTVDYINVRGHIGHETAPFWQNPGYLFHTDSSRTQCTFDGGAGAKSSEDNFGYYRSTNPAFRCSAGPDATTQYWFGSYL